jgi:GTP cyclohydrolase I
MIKKDILNNKKEGLRIEGQKDIENGMIQILLGLKKCFGLNISNENFRLTPKRVARAYYEIFKGINCEEEIHNIAETAFPSTYDGMIIVQDIKCFSMCPHHFLPVEYIVNVAYIPNKKTVGLSKLSRIVELLAKQPELQEEYTKMISILLEKELQPLGVMVHVQGRHMCMAMRGVKQVDCWTTTASVTGSFKKDINTKNEFLNSIKIHR